MLNKLSEPTSSQATMASETTDDGPQSIQGILD
jgi:hypothetical protein